MPIKLQRTSLLPSEKVVLVFEVESSWPEGTHNLNVEILRLGELRDEPVFGLGRDVNIRDQRNFICDGGPELKPGFYKVSSVRLYSPDGRNFQELLDSNSEFFGALHFEVVGESSSDSGLEERVRIFYQQREIALATPVITLAATSCEAPLEVTGIIFGVGATIHSRQNLRGVSIIPYGRGLSYEALRNSVNELFSTQGWSVNPDPAVAVDYARQTPTFAIVVHQLRSANEDDGIDFLSRYAKDINTILGVSNGAVPRSFAIFLFNQTIFHGGFYYDRYRGNLIAPLSVTELAQRMEQLMPKMKHPRARLMLESYADAMREPNRSFQYLRLWTLLELVAKDVIRSDDEIILDQDGNPILGGEGQKIRTNRTLAKVYQYLFTQGYGSSRSDKGETNLWKMLSAAYKVRNAVAHEGEFRPDRDAPLDSPLAFASEQYAQPFDSLFLFLKTTAWLTVLREAATE